MKGHRPFLLLSLTLSSVVGSALGGLLALTFLGLIIEANFGLMLQAHGQLVVYGFVCLFTMGVALMMFCSPLQLAAHPLWLAYLCPLTMLAGIACQLTAKVPEWLGPALQVLSVLSYAVVVVMTRRRSMAQPRHRESFSPTQLVLLASGTAWLVATPLLGLIDSTRALETALWGFPGLYIVAVGLRTHPAILSVKIDGALTPVIGGLWNLALVLRWVRDDAAWSWVMAAAVGLFLAVLRPFRRSARPPAGGSWLRPFVRTSYLWLAVATLLTALAEGPRPELAGAARHAFGSGFVLTMIVGMAFRMVPAYEVRRLLWASGPWVLYWLLTFATALRVFGQARGWLRMMAIGGGLQVLVVWIFSALLLGTCLWGKYLGVSKK